MVDEKLIMNYDRYTITMIISSVCLFPVCYYFACFISYLESSAMEYIEEETAAGCACLPPPLLESGFASGIIFAI